VPAVESDEVQMFYMAQYDWKKTTISSEDYDAEFMFQCLMQGIKISGDAADPNFYAGAALDPEAFLYKLGPDKTEGFNPRYRAFLSFKIPPAPQKNMYIKQMALFIPEVLQSEFGDRTVTNDGKMVMGRLPRSPAFGNREDRLHYEWGTSAWEDYFYNVPNWKKPNGMAKGDWDVKDRNPCAGDLHRYPINGPDGADTILEISDFSEKGGIAEQVIAANDRWWYLELAPRCIVDGMGLTPDTWVHTILWAYRDLSVAGEEDDLFTKIYGHRTLTTDKEIYCPIDTRVWVDINIDGHGDSTGDKIPARPLLCILWKNLVEDEEDVSFADELKVEPSELGPTIAHYEWDRSEEEIEFQGYFIKAGEEPYVIGSAYVFATDERDKNFTDQYAPPGFVDGIVSAVKAWQAVVSKIGPSLEKNYPSNFVPVYRPFLTGEWELGPALYDTDGDKGTEIAARIEGDTNDKHHVHDVLYPCIAGLDSWFTGDACSILYGQRSNLAKDWSDIIDKDLTTAPPAPLLDDQYIIAGTGGGWAAGTINDVAICTNPVGPVWAFTTPVDGDSAYVVDESQGYSYTVAGGWETGGHKYLREESSLSEYVEYETGMDIVLLDTTNHRSIRREISVNTGYYVISATDQDFLEADTTIFIVRKRLKKALFLFGDGGRGSTDEMFELVRDYQEGVDNDIFWLSNTDFLEIGDRICIMDGLNPILYTVKSVSGKEVEVNETVDRNIDVRTQGYKCPKYMYSKTANIEFSGAVEAEDGFRSDFVALEYPYFIEDDAPIAVITAEKLLAEVNETIRFIGIESVLMSFDQSLGSSGARYEWQKDGGGWDATNVPYKDYSWPSTGTKTVELRVRNEDLVYSTIVSIDVEIATTVVAGVISIIIDIADFSNGYETEHISGGREASVDENLSGGSKSYDSPTKRVRRVRLSGVANTRTATHPIVTVHNWRQTKPAAFQQLANDLVTLLYLENFKAALQIELEGEDTYLLLQPLDRRRTWELLEKREWDAEFIIIE
jgi:hypothetical protein